MGRGVDSVLAVLNGLVGDHLARTANGLQTPMAFMRGGEPVALDTPSLQAAYPQLTPRIVVLVHGLMNTEACWAFADGVDYGSCLSRDAGFTPFYLRYNSGLPIVDNGAALARLLDALVGAYPVPIEEILLLGYSMGGLVVRAACHDGASYARRFLPFVHRAVYVGTPHLGAPTERLGRVVASVLRSINDPYTQLVGDIANLRSAGLQDLGDADLRQEDRERRAEGRPAIRLASFRHPVPLLPQVKHYLVAGALSDARWPQAFFGDAIVPVPSALAEAPRDAILDASTPAPVTRLLSGVSHIALAHDPSVYAQILAWVGPEP